MRRDPRSTRCASGRARPVENSLPIATTSWAADVPDCGAWSTGSSRWMCRPARSGRMRAGETLDDRAMRIVGRGADRRASPSMHTKTRPAVSFDSTATPSRKSSPRPASTTRTSGACGCVSIAVTKIDRGGCRGTRRRGRTGALAQRRSTGRTRAAARARRRRPSAATGRPVNDAKRDGVVSPHCDPRRRPARRRRAARRGAWPRPCRSPGAV